MEDSSLDSILNRTSSIITLAGVSLGFLANAVAAYKLSDLFLKTIIFFAFATLFLCALFEFTMVRDISQTTISETTPRTKRYFSIISILIRLFVILAIVVILPSALSF